MTTPRASGDGPVDCLPGVATTVVSMPACPGRLLSVALSAGDAIRADRGLVWFTIDGALDDHFLAAGERRTMAEDTRIAVTGFGRTDFSLLSVRPHPRFVGHGGIRPYAGRRRLARGLGSVREGLFAALRALLAALLHGPVRGA